MCHLLYGQLNYFQFGAFANRSTVDVLVSLAYTSEWNCQIKSKQNRTKNCFPKFLCDFNFWFVSVHVCVCTWACECAGARICVNVWVFRCTCVYSCMCVHACECRCTCVHVCVHVHSCECAGARVYMFVSVQVHVCVCLSVQVHTCLLTSSQMWLESLSTRSPKLGMVSVFGYSHPGGTLHCALLCFSLVNNEVWFL